MAINTNSKAYQWLLDKWYTASEIQQMANAVSSWKTTKQAFDEVKGQRVTTQSTPKSTWGSYVYNPTSWYYEKQSTPSTTTPTKNSNLQTITYNWQVSDRWNTSWTSNMNSMSQNKAIDNSRNFQVGTWDVVDMPQQPKVQSVATPQVDRVWKAWEWLDYETQQKKLNSIAWLKDALAKKGITSKPAPTTTQTTTTPRRTTQTQTPKQDQWDYQDNSQARMDQIANNLNGYRQTMPQLFDDMPAFYNFFIKDKGRSQDQIDFLWDYYDRVQKYGKYDNMSPDQLWTWIANGTIPEDYLNTLKSTDPQKYQEVISYKKDTEDRIMNESYLNDAVAMAWIEWWESEPSSIKYGKWNWIRLDENGDWIDDRRYHAPTEEELQLSQEDSEYEAEKLRLKNAYKDLQSDLTEQYPDADLSTIMVLTSDRGTKIQKALDTISVAQTKTQWRLSYLQNERATMDKAWADSIAQLQKNLWMYYQYSPQWIAELAQAQYWATNITLDQADSWNETQKQMALQNVLDWYYDKYWDIIQRSEQQVINDVIAYAKKNWVWLAQALQENFVKPLQQKPQFATLSSGWLSPTVSFEKVWDTWYVFTVNPDGTYSLESVNGTWTATNWYSFTDYTPISSSQLESWLNNFMSDHPLNSIWWQCGSFVNDYLQSLWYDRLYTDPIDKKAAITNTDEPAVWSIAVMDSKKYPQYWHTAIVTAIDWDKVKLLEANWGDDKKVHERWVNKSEITRWYFNPSLSTPSWNTTWTNNWYDPLLIDFFQKDPTKLTKDQWAKLKNMWYDERTYLSMRDNYLKSLSKEPDASTAKILDTLWYLMTNYPWREELMASIWTKFLPWDYGAKMWDYLSYVDYIKQNLTMDNLVKLKQGWATFGSLTEWERPRIEASATRLSNSMSKDKYLWELLDIYNTYAKNAWMWELTLNDINRMYGSSSSSSISSSSSNSWTPTIKPMKWMEISNVQVNNWDIDYDAIFASL